jgi:uncharacterized protein (DUF736 family)
MTLVQLARRMDREKPCCGNIATIGAGKGPHAAELRCSVCDNHRGWLPRQAIDFLNSVTETFGNSAEPIILRDDSFGGQALTKFDDKNCGVLFKNENKQSEKHSDYRGEVNAAGLDYWIDGWVRTSKKGTRFISFKLKVKDAQPKAEPKVVAFNDEIGF